MNVIKELTEKYSGSYSEDNTTEIVSPIGKYTFQPKKGKFKIDNSRISVALNEVGGATPTGEPIRIILHLENDFKSTFEIFPKSRFEKIKDLIFAKNERNLERQFSFKGNNVLIEHLFSDKKFSKYLYGEKIYIQIKEKFPKAITLTPEYGISDIERFEKYLKILKVIESKVHKLHLTTVNPNSR